MTKIPKIFINRDLNFSIENSKSLDSQLSAPIIDLNFAESDSAQRLKVIEQVRGACENWGFFQVVTHGIPVRVLDGIINGVRKFHEQDAEVKKKLYSRDRKSRKVMYSCNIGLFESKAADWRDILACFMAPHPPNPEELPEICRDIVVDYSKRVTNLVFTLFELLSEALGLSPSYLKDIDCAGGMLLLGHYYPRCPEPELTIGTSKHTDATFMTVLLQDQMGGLQVLHDDHWDVPPVPAALIVNLGDLLQLISNDRFKSVYHRVLAKQVGPRISVACFFRNQHSENLHGPIKELLSDDNSPIYRETSVRDYMAHYYSKAIDSPSSLLHFKL